MDGNSSTILAGTSDAKLMIFDTESSNKPFKKVKAHKSQVSKVAFSKDFNLFASSGPDGRIVLHYCKIDKNGFEYPVVAPLKILKYDTPIDIYDIRFLNYKHYILSLSLDGRVTLWC